MTVTLLGSANHLIKNEFPNNEKYITAQQKPRGRGYIFPEQMGKKFSKI